MVVVHVTLPGVVTGEGTLAKGVMFASVCPFWLIATHTEEAEGWYGDHGGGG